MQDEPKKEEPAPAPAVREPVDVQITNGVFQADSLDKLWRLASIMSSSGLVPKDFAGSVPKTFVAMACGLELGLKVMSSIQNIYVINNRPTIFGDAPLALCNDQIEWIEEEFEGEPFKDDFTAVCTIQAKGKTKPTRRTFSVADARTAKLWQKKGKENQDTPWITYPKRMLQMKARNFALRDACPNGLKGIAIYEDLAYNDPAPPTKEEQVVGDAEVIPNYLTEEPEPIKKESIIQPESIAAKEVLDKVEIRHLPKVDMGKKEPAPAAPVEPLPDDHVGILAKLVRDEALNQDNVDGIIADIVQRQRVSREEVLAQIAKDPKSFATYYKSVVPSAAAPTPDPPPAAPPKGPGRTRKPKTPANIPGPPAEGPAAQEPVIDVDPLTGEVITPIDEATMKEDLSAYLPSERVIREMCYRAHAEDPEYQAKGYNAPGVFVCYLKWAKESVARVSRVPVEKVLEDLANQGDLTIKLFKKWLFNPPLSKGPSEAPIIPPPPPLETKVEPGAPVLQSPHASWKDRLAGLKVKYPAEFEEVRLQMGFASSMPTEDGAKFFVEKIHQFLDQKRKGVKKPNIK